MFQLSFLHRRSHFCQHFPGLVQLIAAAASSQEDTSLPPLVELNLLYPQLLNSHRQYNQRYRPNPTRWRRRCQPHGLLSYRALDSQLHRCRKNFSHRRLIPRIYRQYNQIYPSMRNHWYHLSQCYMTLCSFWRSSTDRSHFAQKRRDHHDDAHFSYTSVPYHCSMCYDLTYQCYWI